MTPRRYPAWLRRRHRGTASQRIMEQLATALARGDDDGIRSALLPSAVLIIDSGGLVPALQTPVEGRDRVTAGLRSLITPAASVQMASINGIPGFVLVRDGLVVAAVTAESRYGMLADLWVVCNPEKLRHWNRR